MAKVAKRIRVCRKQGLALVLPCNVDTSDLLKDGWKCTKCFRRGDPLRKRMKRNGTKKR